MAVCTKASKIRLNSSAAKTKDRAGAAERLAAILDVWPVVLIFALVIGGIYLGWFTPTEGAAVGCAGVGLLAIVRGHMTWADFKECVLGTAVATGMIFFIVLGAAVYNSFLAFTRLPQEAVTWVGASGFDVRQAGG